MELDGAVKYREYSDDAPVLDSWTADSRPEKSVCRSWTPLKRPGLAGGRPLMRSSARGFLPLLDVVRGRDRQFPLWEGRILTSRYGSLDDWDPLLILEFGPWLPRVKATEYSSANLEHWSGRKPDA